MTANGVARTLPKGRSVSQKRRFGPQWFMKDGGVPLDPNK
jgi:hypothetical protein